MAAAAIPQPIPRDEHIELKSRCRVSRCASTVKEDIAKTRRRYIQEDRDSDTMYSNFLEVLVVVGGEVICYPDEHALAH